MKIPVISNTIKKLIRVQIQIGRTYDPVVQVGSGTIHIASVLLTILRVFDILSLFVTSDVKHIYTLARFLAVRSVYIYPPVVNFKSIGQLLYAQCIICNLRKFQKDTLYLIRGTKCHVRTCVISVNNTYSFRFRPYNSVRPLGSNADPSCTPAWSWICNQGEELKNKRGRS